MLKLVLIHIENATNNAVMSDLLSSLQSHNIQARCMNLLELSTMTDILKKATTLPDDTLIVTDSHIIADYASRMGITCIGVQQSFEDSSFIKGADCVTDSLETLDYNYIQEEYNRAHNLPTIITTTKRLIIREMTTEDIPAMYHLYDDKKFVRFIPSLDTLAEEIEKHKAYITHMYNFYRFGLWGVFLKETNILIGRCGLQCIDIGDHTEVELSYLLHPEYCHQGYGYEATTAILTYAREALELDSVVARIHPDNKPSLKLAHKLGFVYETQLLPEEECIYRIDFAGQFIYNGYDLERNKV